MKRLTIVTLLSCFVWACGTGYQQSNPTKEQEKREVARVREIIRDDDSTVDEPQETISEHVPKEISPAAQGTRDEDRKKESLQRLARVRTENSIASGDAINAEGGVGGGGAAQGRTSRGIAVLPDLSTGAALSKHVAPPVPEPVVTPFNREGYNAIYENQFLEVGNNPLSTFSIDVDAASYSNIRRFITSNQLPHKDVIRIEEMVNYFTYDYPEPEGDRPFSINTEVSAAPWNKNHRLVHIGLQGKRIATEDLPPANLVFLLDVSGSMRSPAKLPLLKSAFRLLVGELRPQDRVAIVVYAGAAGVVLPSTPGTRKEDMLRVLDRLNAGGSTAGGAGINMAYDIALAHFNKGGNNRVILATDGDFNVGASSDAELVRLIEEKRDHGVFLTVLGFGSGNYQDAKMEQLADKGNGNYAYIDNIREARKVLVNEMGSTLLTIAKDVKIQVEFNPVQVKAYRLIGYENRMLAKEDFNNDKKDAGELGAGHTVTALYEVIPPGLDVPGAQVDPLKYQTTRVRPGTYASTEMMNVKLRYKKPDGDTSRLIEVPVRDFEDRIERTSENFRFSAAVAEFGLILRNSEFKGAASYEQVLHLAKGSQGLDRFGYRSEFIRMVETCSLLAPRFTTSTDFEVQ